MGWLLLIFIFVFSFHFWILKRNFILLFYLKLIEYIGKKLGYVLRFEFKYILINRRIIFNYYINKIIKLQDVIGLICAWIKKVINFYIIISFY